MAQRGYARITYQSETAATMTTQHANRTDLHRAQASELWQLVSLLAVAMATAIIAAALTWLVLGNISLLAGGYARGVGLAGLAIGPFILASVLALGLPLGLFTQWLTADLGPRLRLVAFALAGAIAGWLILATFEIPARNGWLIIASAVAAAGAAVHFAPIVAKRTNMARAAVVLALGISFAPLVAWA